MNVYLRIITSSWFFIFSLHFILRIWALSSLSYVSLDQNKHFFPKGLCNFEKLCKFIWKFGCIWGKNVRAWRPGLKESRHYLQREDSIELTNQYQRDREATSAVLLVRVEKTQPRPATTPLYTHSSQPTPRVQLIFYKFTIKNDLRVR